MSTNIDQDKTEDNIPTEVNEITTDDNHQTTAATEGDNPNQDDTAEQQPQPDSSSLAADSNMEQHDNSNEEQNNDTVESQDHPQDHPQDQSNNHTGEEQTQLKDGNEAENIDENPESRQSNSNSKAENVEEGDDNNTARDDAENVTDTNPDDDHIVAEMTNQATDDAEEDNNNNQEITLESNDETNEDAKDVEEKPTEDTDNVTNDENVAENEEEPEVSTDKETHQESIHESDRNSPTIPPLAEKLDDDVNDQPDEEAPIEDLDARQTPTSDYYDENTPSDSNSTFEEHDDYEGDLGTSKEDEEIAMPKFDRAFLLEQYQLAYTERDQVNTMNLQLQHKLAEHFRKKKTEEKQDLDRNITDQEQRYLKYMSTLEELHKEETRIRENIKEQIEELVKKRDDKHDKVSQARNEFMGFKKEVAKNALNSRSGKAIPQKDTDQYISLELRKDHEVVQVRLENIKSKNKLKKREMQLKQKEELAEGLHLIDFEQLKIENQTYNEKIEERNEEILKLRKKITSTVQVLTHVKEKLQFVQAETSELKDDLKKVEVQVAKKRDVLSRNKQVRDALRIENVKLREKCGLLGNESLLRDYEEKKDEAEYLLTRLEQLKMTHAELTLKCNGVRQKIEQSQSTPIYS